MSRNGELGQSPDFFSRYLCAGEFLCAAAEAEEATGSCEIPYLERRDLMLRHNLKPVEVHALATTAAARMGNMLRDLHQDITALEGANEGTHNG